MVGPKKDTAYFSDSLAAEGGVVTTSARFKVTMPSGKPPTLEELQQIMGIPREQATKLLQEILR